MFARPDAPIPDALDLSARCRQLRELGGDFYDSWPLPGKRLAMAIGDASGKGLAAALMSSNVQSSLRTASLFTDGEGPATVAAVNRQVYGSSLDNRYATLLYGVLDAETRVLRYVNAGHPPAMVMHSDGRISWLESSGAPVGMFAEWNYQESCVQLHSGDVLVAYSDGLIEAVAGNGEEWGVDGLKRAAAEEMMRSAAEMVEGIFSRRDAYTREHQTDDTTVMVMRVAVH